MQSEGELTASQWLWFQCQLLLDDGVQVCLSCEGLGTGIYCPTCGKRFHPEGQRCPECQLEGQGAYCQQCGAVMGSSVGDAIEAGTYDWDAWAETLTPFLHGLSPQEQTLLARG